MSASSVAPSLLAALLVLAAPAVARGDGGAAEAETGTAPSKTTWELAGIGAYGTAPIRGATTPFGLGFGGRIGLDVSGFYVGVRIVDYLGGTDVDLSDRALLYGATFGYGFRFDAFAGTRLTVRPELGGGGVTIFHTDPSSLQTTDARTGAPSPDVVTSASGSSRSDTTTVDTFYLEPGVTVLWSGPSAPFVGVEARTLVLPSIAYGGAPAATWLSYGVDVDLGVRF